jgi:hypothetical protein
MRNDGDPMVVDRRRTEWGRDDAVSTSRGASSWNRSMRTNQTTSRSPPGRERTEMLYPIDVVCLVVVAAVAAVAAVVVVVVVGQRQWP